jgi:hypothetical protein
MDDTAWHIVRTFPTMTEDLRAIFKLECYCRERQLRRFRSQVLCRRRHEIADGVAPWWHPHAKYVVPISDDEDPFGKDTDLDCPESWKEIVRRGARMWRRLAEEWLVIRTPKLMDANAAEHGGVSAVGRADSRS